MINKASELPEEYKQYLIRLSNGQEYLISGDIKSKLMGTRDQFVQLPRGDVINKSFIVSISFHAGITRDSFLQLPEEERQLLISGNDKLLLNQTL